ncbi:MAG: VIT domain-containing protein [Myxococcota bacterium]
MRCPVGPPTHPRRRCAYGASLLLLIAPACVPAATEASPQPPALEVLDSLELRGSTLPPRAFEATHRSPSAPVSLTASDGTGLELTALEARGVVQGPLAFTELQLTFRNPRSRPIEGRFTIDLPHGSAISRFAMKIGDEWQEGEVVERQAAHVAYEDFLHVRQDPALLENQAGNRFSARVFPIPPRAHKEIVVSYSQELTADAPYKVLLEGLPELASLDVEVLIDEPQPAAVTAPKRGRAKPAHRVVRVRERDFMPRADVEVAFDKGSDEVGLRHEELAVARVRAVGDMAPDPVRDLTVLLDTSASRALDFDGQLRRLGALIEALARDDDFPLRVLAFDQEVSLVFDGDARSFGAEQLGQIYSRRALGASDLAGALASAAGGAASRVLVMGDGIATAGKTEARDLKRAVGMLGKAGVERIDAVIDGGLRDEDVLATLTTAGLARDGVVADARLPAETLADKLTRATVSGVRVSVPGSTFHWPSRLDGVQPGDEVFVYAQLPVESAMTVVLAGEQTVEKRVTLMPAERPLLERALVGARIDAMTLQRSELGRGAATARDELQDSIVALSTKHRVLSDFTAMLVLETESDYRRFDIARDALTDIMHVGASGIELRHRERPSGHTDPAAVWAGHPRRSPATLPPGATPSPAIERASPGADTPDGGGGAAARGVGEGDDLGSFGLIGHGGGGRRRGAEASSAPRIRPGAITVGPGLDKSVVRRVIRSHLREVSACYSAGPVRDESVHGRVEIELAVGPRGAVVVSKIDRNTLGDRRLGKCIAEASKSWEFPRPTTGGTAVVTASLLFDGTTSFEPEPAPPPTAEEIELRRIAREAAARELKRLAAESAKVVEEHQRTAGSPYLGRMFDVMTSIGDGTPDEALAIALEWRDEAPGEVLAIIALGEALEASGQRSEAARAYGSLIDLFPSRADLRRYAGARLDRVGEPGQRLAVDTYRRAVRLRPDHPSGHRLYAYALVRHGEHRAAFDAINIARTRVYPPRFRGVPEILAEDARIIAAAWSAAEPTGAVRASIEERGVSIATQPSTRFVINWETDANDVDFHVRDGGGGHAYFDDPALSSGGRLFADVRTGYGPECFAVGGVATAYPYQFRAQYYSRGPMGYGMGKLQILQHDGRGGLKFEDRPFLIMKDGAEAELGSLAGPL